MKWLGLASLLAVLLIAAARSNPKAEKTDVDALQGTWVLKEVEYLGETAAQDDELERKRLLNDRLPEEKALTPDLRFYRTTLTIKGNTFSLQQPYTRLNSSSRGWWAIEGTYRLDVGKNPKRMERTSATVTYHQQDGKSDTTSVKEKSYCIYSINGNTLLWCQERDGALDKLPGKFATDRDENVFLLKFRREKD